MSYQSESIATVINRLNVRYFLPAIQREFVWSPEQIVRLFDSILRGYPISSFLFWELQSQNKDKWQIYKFIERFKQGGTHNEPASSHGVDQLTLILDGQQRLTSLLLGLKGTYTIKKPRMWWGNPNAWVEQRLYLDLLRDPRVEDDVEDGDIRYGFGFLSEAPKGDDGHHWIEAGRILSFDSEDRFYDFREQEKEKLPDSVTKGQLSVFDRTLDRLYRAMWRDDAISFYTEHDQNYDRVLDIFVRANEGGTPLSKSDLLLALVTSNWEGMNTREEIYSFVDHINNNLTRKNNFDKDFVLKTALCLSDLPVKYKVDNFNRENLQLIRVRWEGIKFAIERGIDLANSFGIDRDTLTSANALIPIIYYLYRHPTANLRGSSSFEVANAGRVRRWLTMALLNNVFGRSADTVLAATRRVLQNQPGTPFDFPDRALNAQTTQLGQPSRFDEYAVEHFLSTAYSNATAFLALSLFYDDISWGTMPYHQDHIFPQSLFSDEHLAAAGVPSDLWERYRELENRIGNLELLLGNENQEKSDEPLDQWLQSRDAAFRQRHLIPGDDALLYFDHFEDFITAREKLIEARLRTLFGTGNDNSETLLETAV
jgi:hypothetical protein